MNGLSNGNGSNLLEDIVNAVYFVNQFPQNADSYCPSSTSSLQLFQLSGLHAHGFVSDSHEPLLLYKQVVAYLAELFPSLGNEHVKLLETRLKISLTEKPDLGSFIRQTDAENLLGTFSTLIGRKEKLVPSIKRSLKFLSVEHNCFSGAKGRFYPELPKDYKRVECQECGSMFYPIDFVRHSHDFTNVANCHWGFNPANWRNLLSIPESPNCDVQSFRECLAMDLNPSNVGHTGPCPIWSRVEDVLHPVTVNSTMNEEEYPGFSNIIVHLLKCGSYQENSVKELDYLIRKAVDERIQALTEEKEKIKKEIEFLKNELMVVDRQISMF